MIWSGILLTYTLAINPIIGFIITFTFWKLPKLHSEKVTVLILAMLIFFIGNYNVAEFVFNTLFGITAVQLLNLLFESEQQTQKNFLPTLYISMLIYYALRMTLVFEVPEILQPAHELYLTAAKYLTENPNAAFVITAGLLLLNAIIFLKKNTDENLLLLVGTIFGMFGLEDMTVIIVLAVVEQVILRKGVEKIFEYKKFVYQAGKVHKL